METLKKLKIGWFTFTCCEDSAIVFTELLNDHYKEWIKLIDFRHVRILRTANVLDNLDVAFVEGAISSYVQEEKLKEIRNKSKYLVAVGSCAVIGTPSNQRNFFDQATNEEIKPILSNFSYKEKVSKLGEIVTVDAIVPGCPMDEKIFLGVVNHYLREYGLLGEEENAHG